MDRLVYYDALTHVTTDGEWETGGYDSSLSAFASQRGVENLKGAVICCKGAGNSTKHALEESIRERLPSFSPVFIRYVQPWSDEYELRELISLYKSEGYRGLKWARDDHSPPWSLTNSKQLLKCATEAELPLHICTFTYKQTPFLRPVELLAGLDSAIQNCGGRHSPIILCHAGLHDVMTYYEYVRFRKNIYLDISYLASRYTSIYDRTLEFLVRNLDRHLLMGSDWPEYSADTVMNKLRSLVRDAPDKLENIYLNNFQNIYP